jgi:hypothetical protein
MAADRLAQFALLRDTVRDPVLWGGHGAGHNYQPEANALTAFNPFVWRRMYLSLFMFTGSYQIERVGSLTVLHLPCRFRNALDMGAYPYPFWHSQKKWDNYQRAIEVTLVIEKRKVIAGYRSDKEDPSRPYVAHRWDGKWHWRDAAGRQMPYASLYTYLFAASNPHVGRLDAAYRALEAEARQHNCAVCHSPANPAQMNPLRLLNYPNQALTVRHEIVRRLEENMMPPGGMEKDTARQKLMDLAKAFAEVGDQALDFEGEFQAGVHP